MSNSLTFLEDSAPSAGCVEGPETLEEAGGGDWGSEIRRDEKVWDGGEKEIGD